MHYYRKHEGKFCSCKIKTNLNGNPSDYLCCSYSKLHCPKKRNIIEKKTKDTKRSFKPHKKVQQNITVLLDKPLEKDKRKKKKRRLR